MGSGNYQYLKCHSKCLVTGVKNLACAKANVHSLASPKRKGDKTHNTYTHFSRWIF